MYPRDNVAATLLYAMRMSGSVLQPAVHTGKVAERSFAAVPSFLLLPLQWPCSRLEESTWPLALVSTVLNVVLRNAVLVPLSLVQVEPVEYLLRSSTHLRRRILRLAMS